MSFVKPHFAGGLFATVAWCALAGGLAGCSTPLPEDSVIRGPARLVGLATTVGEPKDFVVASRRGDERYIPVGVTPPDHRAKPKTPAQLAEYEKTLNTRREHSQKTASRAAQPFKPLQQPRVLPPIPGSTIDSGAANPQPDAPARVQSP
jgi:hypothetical protein